MISHVSLVKDGTKMKILSEIKPLIFIMINDVCMNVCLFVFYLTPF